MAAYSDLRILTHTDRIDDILQGKQPVPVSVHLNLNDHCNQDCSFCSFRSSSYINNEFSIEGVRNPRRHIPYEKLIEITSDLEQMGVKGLILTGGGEPTAHPSFSPYLDRLAASTLDVGMITNGLLLHRYGTELSKFKWVRISLDAGTKEIYSKVRNVSENQFKVVLDGIKHLVFQGYHREVGVSFVVTKENYGEIYKAAEIVKELGVNHFKVSALRQLDKTYYKKIGESIRNQIASLYALETDRFKVYNKFNSGMIDINRGNPTYETCYLMQIQATIGGDQNVYACCVQSYNKRGLVGNIKNQSFREMWESPEKQEMMRSFDARKCEHCIYNNHNHLIKRVVETADKHSNFI